MLGADNSADLLVIKSQQQFSTCFFDMRVDCSGQRHERNFLRPGYCWDRMSQMCQGPDFFRWIVNYAGHQVRKVVLNTPNSSSSFFAVVVAGVSIDHLDDKREDLLVLSSSCLAFRARGKF